MSRKSLVLLVSVALVGGAMAYFSPTARNARQVDDLITRNLEARGGLEAWSSVSAMRIAGLMDLGQEMVVPYTLEQKRPGMMCFEFEFADQLSTQCTDGETGWKIAPFRGRMEPVAMTRQELREVADMSDPYGLLYDIDRRNLEIEVVGVEQIDGRDTYKLEVSLPKGGKRWLYLDAETALDVRMETIRTIAGRDHRVETEYKAWRNVEGLLIPVRQETRTTGERESHFLTVETVVVNPQITDDRFHIPAAANNVAGSAGNGAS